MVASGVTSAYDTRLFAHSLARNAACLDLRLAPSRALRVAFLDRVATWGQVPPSTFLQLVVHSLLFGNKRNGRNEG